MWRCCSVVNEIRRVTKRIAIITEFPVHRVIGTSAVDPFFFNKITIGGGR